MSIITPYIENLNRLKEEIPSKAKEIITENAPNILYMIKYEQLAKGMDYQGQMIVHPEGDGTYAQITQDYYAKQPPKPRKPKVAGQRYNMEWEGTFFDGLGVKVEDDGYNIFSTNGKKEFLEKIYGTKLTIFTKEHNDKINNLVLLPNLYKYLLDNLLRVKR